MNAAERVPTPPGFDAAPPAEEGTSWESFYQGYRKPGYIAGYEILHNFPGKD